MRPAALRAKSSIGCAPLCEAARLLESSAFVVAGDYERGGSLLPALIRVRLYKAVGRKG